MILTEDQIKEYILNPKNKRLINYLIKEKKKHELHVAGYGIEDFIDTVDGIEDKDYKKVKLKFKNYKTVQIYHKILKPFQNIFTAKGGSIFYNTDDDKVKEKMKEFLNSKIGDKYNLDEWMRKLWITQLNIDPMGMTFINIDPKTEDPYLSYYSVYQRQGHNIYLQIHDFDYSNITKVEYLILNWDQIENKQTKQKYNIYRVIDDNYDYLVKQNVNDKEDISIIEEATQENPFKIVPAVINSNRLDNQDLEAKTTYIKESLIGADDCLNDYIDYRIYKKKISIPRIWEFKTACGKCGGTGKYDTYDDLENGQKILKQSSCDNCRGTGEEAERSLTDIFKIDLVEASQNYIPPTGSVTLPTAIQEQMTTEMTNLEIEMFETIWGQGGYIETDRANTTAFEISVRNEQKTHQLMTVSENKVIVEQALINLVGNYLFGDGFKGVVIKPPNQYILNTGTQSMSVYLEAKKENASDELLNQLYREYLVAEYANNEAELIKLSKLFVVEPYPHYNIIEIKDIATDIEFTVKKNLVKYIVRYEKEFSRIYLTENTVEKITEQFYAWAKEETNENISKTPDQGTDDV